LVPKWLRNVDVAGKCQFRQCFSPALLGNISVLSEDIAQDAGPLCCLRVLQVYVTETGLFIKGGLKSWNAL